MNMPTRDPRTMMAGIASALERLKHSWGASARRQNPTPSGRPARMVTANRAHDRPRVDIPDVAPRKAASGQDNFVRKQLHPRAYRRSSAARSDRMGQLKSALVRYLSWPTGRAEDTRLNRAREALKPLLDMMPAAMIVVDDANKVVQANQLAATLFSYKAEEMSGLSFAQLFPRLDNDAVARRGHPSSSGAPEDFSASSARRTAVARCKDGSERPVSVKCTHYRPAGAFVWVVTADDVQAHAEMVSDESQHAHLARVFELAEMAAVLAHEINQPLTAILSNAQAVQRFLHLTRSGSTDLREAFADIVADSFRATEIVRKLRQFVRRAAPETRSIDIGSLVSGAMHLMRRDAVVRGVSVTLDIGRRVPLVRGDSIQLQQVMINLLQNAFDAVEGCCAEHRVVSVKVDTAAQGEGVSISVSDRGPGLKAEQLGEMFSPFPTSKPQGLGLGLSISISIISMHGGRLWAESNGERGATFRLVLPSAGEVDI
ncbi:sensor histidine kinase [Paraburkholderia sp. SIMBA_053]|uniref:sensor histidine kinase n=1 Tax=Paraburkholderia sp. SIMBA_053 TaxID=3085794 RepID=UPI00397DF0B0